MTRYLWLTDTHLFSWNKEKLLTCIQDEAPDGVFLTGDIAHAGSPFLSILDMLGLNLDIPVYFVRGNHDVWLNGIEATNAGIQELTSLHDNLIWMSDADVVSLNKDTALIGQDGWYDCRLGYKHFIRFTFDWFMIPEFRQLKTMEERFEAFRQRADAATSALFISLEQALMTHKTVYLLTHVPPWREAHELTHSLTEAFYLPSNVNYGLGEMLENVMRQHKGRQLIVLSGHTHAHTATDITENIECRVGQAGIRERGKNDCVFV